MKFPSRILPHDVSGALEVDKAAAEQKIESHEKTIMALQTQKAEKTEALAAVTLKLEQATTSQGDRADALVLKPRHLAQSCYSSHACLVTNHG